MIDSRPPLAPMFSIFGVAATITPHGSASPIETTVVWQATRPSQVSVGGGAVLDSKPRLTVRRDEVADLPLRSLILAPALEGGTASWWMVSRLDQIDSQVITAAVTPTTDPEA